MKLSIIDYMEYLGGTNTSRCVYEGEEVLNAGHLLMCGRLDSTSQERNIGVCGLCLQTSDLKSHPHEIKGQLEVKNNKLKVIKMHCSCKAGNSGKCKHISALLIKCTRCMTFQFKKGVIMPKRFCIRLEVDLETFEAVSQTELKCTWSKQKNLTEDKYHAVPVNEMLCIKNTEDKEMELVVDENEMFNFFVQKQPSSALAKHMLGRRSLSSIDTITISNSESKDLYSIILDNAIQSPLMMELHCLEIVFVDNCCEQMYSELFEQNEESVTVLSPQHSKAWHEQRKFRVTGSRVYGLYTYSGQDWDKKSLKYFYPKKFTNKFIKHGLKYEAEAKDVFNEKTGYEIVECGLLISNFNPWLGYSPDGIIMEEGKPRALLEIKCLYNGSSATIKEAITKASFLKNNNGVYELKKKHQYYGQIQLGMAILNLPSCYFVVYASYDKSVEIFEIMFDYDFAKKMLSTVKHNFFQNMLHNLCCHK